MTQQPQNDPTVKTKSNTDKTLDSGSKEVQSKTKPPGVLGVFQSVLAAMFGVQSDEKREQDFEHGNVGNYIFVGIVMVIVFILTIVAIVNSILESAGQ